MLDVAAGTRGEDHANSDFFAEALPRAAWDTGHNHLQAVERVVLVHRLREVVAQVGFTPFEAVGADERGELDLEGIAPAALSPEPLWFPAIENRGEGVFIPSFRGDYCMARKGCGGSSGHSAASRRQSLGG